MKALKSFAGATLIAIVGSLAGCASSIGGDGGLVTALDPANAMLRLRGAVPTDVAISRVAFANPWEYEEYAGVTTPDLRLELVYVQQLGDNTAVEYPYPRRRMIQTWRHNAGRAIDWGGQGRVFGPFTDYWYDRYTLSDSNAACAGFDAEWDSPSLDPRIRPGKVVIGYVCAAPGKSLTDTAIEAVLAGIGIRGITQRIRAGDPAQVARDFGAPLRGSAKQTAAALAVARQGADGISGNPSFPFNFVVTYTTGDDSRSGQ